MALGQRDAIGFVWVLGIPGPMRSTVSRGDYTKFTVPGAPDRGFHAQNNAVPDTQARV